MIAALSADVAALIVMQRLMSMRLLCRRRASHEGSLSGLSPPPLRSSLDLLYLIYVFKLFKRSAVHAITSWIQVNSDVGVRWGCEREMSRSKGEAEI